MNLESLRRSWKILCIILFVGLSGVACGGDDDSDNDENGNNQNGTNTNNDETGTPILDELDDTDFVLAARLEESATDELELSNIGDADLNFEFDYDAEWLSFSPGESTIAEDASTTVDIEATCGTETEELSADVDLITDDPDNETTALTFTLSCSDEAVQPGTLDITVDGLPDEAQANVTVTGPDDFETTVTESDILSDLTPGDYILTPQPVSHDDDVYTADEVEVTLDPAQTEDVQITYEIGDEVLPGSLEITVIGLPTDTDADITVDGPDADDVAIIETTTLSDLTIGEYTVTAADVDADGTIYSPDASTQTITVASDTESSITIEYTEVVGLTVTSAANDGPGSLRDVIANASAGAVISIEEGLEAITLSDEITVDKDITIDGASHGAAEISGDDTTRHFAVEDVTFILQNLTLRNGSADDGGSIANSGFLHAENVTFADNQATGNGGAIFSDGDISLTNSTLAGNLADNGGAIYHEAETLTVVHSTIADNTANTAGGGLYLSDSAVADIGRSIIADNAAPAGADIGTDLTTGELNSLGYNLVGSFDGSALVDGEDGDIIGTVGEPIDPQLGELSDNGGPSPTMALHPSSDAYGHAAIDECLATDQRGIDRSVADVCDLGAHETGGFETFDLFPGTSQYSDGDYVGDREILWTYGAEARVDEGFQIDGAGMMFRNNNTSVISESVEGGVSSISVDARKAYTGGSERRVSIYVNDELVAESAIFGTSGDEEEEVHVISATDLEYEGPVTIEVRNDAPGGGNSQVVIDNLEWDGYVQ